MYGGGKSGLVGWDLNRMFFFLFFSFDRYRIIFCVCVSKLVFFWGKSAESFPWLNGLVVEMAFLEVLLR